MSELYHHGLCPADIADRLDLTTRSVYRHLADAGVHVTPGDDWRRKPRSQETP